MAKKKRPQYITEIVEKVNADLKRRGVKTTTDPLATWLISYLLDKKMYNGYNMYVTKILYNGEIGLTLAGTADSDKYECIQIW